uniref:Uncharacterized protein n=1 Tax=uncultured marine virus TaxID=186617 RepID=A0A0F7L8H5_9VIRU|nr:hypothetical protein [uncultured marine virus]
MVTRRATIFSTLCFWNHTECIIKKDLSVTLIFVLQYQYTLVIYLFQCNFCLIV